MDATTKALIIGYVQKTNKKLEETKLYLEGLGVTFNRLYRSLQ